MPIYNFRCLNCDTDVEISLPTASRNDPRIHSCGEPLQRVMSLPLPCVIKHTGKDMALASLNDKSTAYMKPEHKQAALQGISEPPKTFY